MAGVLADEGSVNEVKFFAFVQRLLELTKRFARHLEIIAPFNELLFCRAEVVANAIYGAVVDFGELHGEQHALIGVHHRHQVFQFFHSCICPYLSILNATIARHVGFVN